MSPIFKIKIIIELIILSLKKKIFFKNTSLGCYSTLINSFQNFSLLILEVNILSHKILASFYS